MVPLLVPFSRGRAQYAVLGEPPHLAFYEIIPDLPAVLRHGDAAVTEHRLERSERATRLSPRRRERVPAQVRVEAADPRGFPDSPKRRERPLRFWLPPGCPLNVPTRPFVSTHGHAETKTPHEANPMGRRLFHSGDWCSSDRQRVGLRTTR